MLVFLVILTVWLLATALLFLFIEPKDVPALFISTVLGALLTIILTIGALTVLLLLGVVHITTPLRRTLAAYFMVGVVFVVGHTIGYILYRKDQRQAHHEEWNLDLVELLAITLFWSVFLCKWLLHAFWRKKDG